jgi:hypothetical protein
VRPQPGLLGRVRAGARVGVGVGVGVRVRVRVRVKVWVRVGARVRGCYLGRVATAAASPGLARLARISP